MMAAREAARTAANLDELRKLLESFEGCALRNTATQLVFADGNPEGRVMFVGEAPGHEEDISGSPFVGRSGKLLDRMIEAIGLDRTKVYIANVVPWRPPGNRTPTPQETAICLPFIRRQIELANPDILVCLGGPSMQTLLGTKDGITRMRGRWFPFDTGTREIRAMATFHPAFLLRSPLQKRLSWRDFLAIKEIAQPRCAGAQPRQQQEQISAAGNFRRILELPRGENNQRQDADHHDGADEGREIGVDVLDADLGEDRGERGEHRRQHGPKLP
jgi:uracil-DNA glycosylase family 4